MLKGILRLRGVFAMCEDAAAQDDNSSVDDEVGGGKQEPKLELTMPGDPKLEPYIEFRDVSKAFGDNVVLDHVNFDVMPAETVCILGRSGVGKSVSLHE